MQRTKNQETKKEKRTGKCWKVRKPTKVNFKNVLQYMNSTCGTPPKSCLTTKMPPWILPHEQSLKDNLRGHFRRTNSKTLLVTYMPKQGQFSFRQASMDIDHLGGLHIVLFWVVKLVTWIQWGGLVFVTLPWILLYVLLLLCYEMVIILFHCLVFYWLFSMLGVQRSWL